MTELSIEKKPANHYVDNAKFYQALCDYRVLTNAAKAKGLDRESPEWPRVPEYIGECFLKIATHLAYRYNFIGYTFRDDMISDGLDNCLRYISNFDEVTYKNPHAYFTTVNYWAFVRRIETEKKLLKNKYDYIAQLDIADMITQNHDDGEFHNEFVKYLQEQLDSLDPSKRNAVPKKKAGRPKKVKPDIDDLTK